MADALKAHPYTKNLSQLGPEDRDLMDPHARPSTTAADGTHDGHHEDQLAHPVPLWMLLATFAVLMVLSVLTVTATWIDLGPLNIWIALAIAAVKAAFVAIIFMHLRWDNPFNTLALLAALAFLTLFVGIAIMDTGEYQNLKAPPGGYAPALQEPGAQ